MFNILSFQSSFLLIHDVFVDSPYSASAVVFHGVEISPLLSWGEKTHLVLSIFQKIMFLPYSGNHEANSCNPLWSFAVYLAKGLCLPQVYVVYDTL